MEALAVAALLLSIIKFIAIEGLPALDKIAEEIKKWGSARNIPMEVWQAMFKRINVDYFDVVDKPQS